MQTSVLSRRRHEAIVIDDQFTVTVLDVASEEVTLEIRDFEGHCERVRLTHRQAVPDTVPAEVD